MGRYLRLVTLFFAVALSTQVHATIVRFDTTEGSFDINLFDNDTPLTVGKFIGYVNSGAYDGTFVHRSVTDFVIQGGGFSYDPALVDVTNVRTLSASRAEPFYSNVRGTIAMARVGGFPNSATSQWFINLSDDNAPNLDSTDGGFTVFGQVIDSGMNVVDAIGAIPTFDLTEDATIDDGDTSVGFEVSALATTPLKNYTDTLVLPDESNFIRINSVTVIDDDRDSAIDLTPELNPEIQFSEGDDDGGGTSSFFTLLALSLVLVVRRMKARRST